MPARTVHRDTLQPVALEREKRTVLPTSEAAFHLNRKSQTLRLWSSRRNSPIQPRLVHGRLAWPVADIRRLLGVAEVSA